jgi:GDP-L-fucose synthase
MKVLITGADGMVGMALRAVSKDFSHHDCIFCTRDDADLTNGEQVDMLFNKHRPDYVIHTAALCGGIVGNENHQADYFYNNILINSHVINFANKYGVKRLLASSSTCVFPFFLDNFDESQMHLGEPHDSHFAYAYTKRMIDIQIRAYARQHGVKYTSIISGNIYGPYDNYDLKNGKVIPSLIHKFFLANSKNTDVVVWGNGTAKREFIYSFDLARIYLLLLDLEQELPNKILIGHEKEITIQQLINTITKISKFKNNIIFDKNESNGQLKKKANVFLLNNLLPNFEHTDFESSLQKSYFWFVENYPNARGV